MRPIKDTITPAAPDSIAPHQPSPCPKSTAARPEFADRLAYYADVRLSIAAAAGEVTP